MKEQSMGYFVFGLTLVIIFIAIVGYYYSKKRHTKVESPKYKMLDDDDQ
jgi:cbb3-type cytochrome oxidase subunit 3